MTDQPWRLFIEHQFDESAEWIPFLPRPGEFKHPVYGDLSFTPERNGRFVQNFKSGVYQTRIPIDAEHQTKVSGAMGWITDMRTNEDGSADAAVEWTDRGKAMVAKKRFRYISPEIYDDWVDPATETEYKDIAIGAALTTRPFFKESHLRPLIANEQGIFAPEGEIDDSQTIVFMQLRKEEPMADKPQVESITPQAFAELQNQFTEMKSALAESEQKRAEAEGQAQKYQEALDATNQRIANMEQAAKTRRFTELADGHDGPRWLGEVEAHVKVMSGLAEAFGEDSDVLKGYVEQQQAIAKQVESSELFKEHGSDRAPQPRTAADEMDAKAKELMAADAKLTYAQAYSEVLERNPALYERHLKGE